MKNITWNNVETAVKWTILVVIVVLGILLVRHSILNPNIPFEL